MTNAPSALKLLEHIESATPHTFTLPTEAATSSSISTSTDTTVVGAIKVAHNLAKKQLEEKILNWGNDDWCARDYLTRTINISLVVEIGTLATVHVMWNRLKSRFTENTGT